MPDTEVEITELIEIDPDRVDAVTSPANGTDWLILKAIDGSETTGTTEDVLAEIAELAETEEIGKSDEREPCADGPCVKCFGTGLAPQLGETPEELMAAAKAVAASGQPVPVREKCPTCHGHGKVLNTHGAPTDITCPDCDGTGKDSTEPPSDTLARVDGDGHHIHEGDAKGREKVDKSEGVELCEDEDCEVCKEAFDTEEKLEKAKLKAKTRNALAESDFALPGRRYPIHDISHARNALARVSQHGTPEEKATVRRKVHARYPGIAMAEKATGTTFSAPNPALATDGSTLAGPDNSLDGGAPGSGLGSAAPVAPVADSTPDGSADVPGSPAWEAVDAQIATDAATALLAAAELIRCFKDRENQEVAAGEGNDLYDTFDACEALCSVNDAVGIMARMAFHEGLEASKSLEEDEDVEKAGRRLSHKSAQSLAALRDDITNLLGDDDPTKPDDSDGAAKSVEIDMDALSKEIDNMTTDELTKVLDAREDKLVGILAEAMKGGVNPVQDVNHSQSIPKAKAANSKAKAKKPKAEMTDLEDEHNQGTNDSASSPATGAAKSEEEEVAPETETEEVAEVEAEKSELTAEEIEAKQAKKEAKKALKDARKAEKSAAKTAALTKAIEEATAEVRNANTVLQERLEQVEKMAAPTSIMRTAPADAQIAAKARDDRDMAILTLERKARESSDPDVKKAAREELRELRSAPATA